MSETNPPVDYGAVLVSLEAAKRREAFAVAAGRLGKPFGSVLSAVIEFADEHGWAIQDIAIEAKTVVEGDSLFVQMDITGPGEPNPLTFWRRECCLTNLPEQGGSQTREVAK